MTAAPIMTLREVSKSYRRGSETVTAVDCVDLDIGVGMTVIVGASGSGKTTLLNLVVGWERPDDGTVHGQPTHGDWSALAIVPQSIGLLEEISVAENISLPARLGATQRVETNEVMDALGLASLADRLPSETSLGEQQRTAIARALCVHPRLLIADEPTSHQDEGNTARIVGLFADAGRRTAVLIASHDRRVITSATTVFEMVDGRLRSLERSDQVHQVEPSPGWAERVLP